MKILTQKQLANTLRVNPRLISRLVAAGEIPTKGVGKSTKMFEDMVAHWMEQQRRPVDALPFDSAYEIPTDWLTSKEVCQLLEVSSSTLARYRQQGYLPYYQFGPHTVRFREIDVVAFGVK